MTPSVDDRLASVVRALSDVVLPSLPIEANLAREQVQLAIGHIQVLRGQIDALPAIELDELADAIDLGDALVAATATAQAAGRNARTILAREVAAAADATKPAAIRSARAAIHAAIDGLVRAEPGHSGVSAAILRSERERALKERRQFAPFGFDPAPPPGDSALRTPSRKEPRND